MNRDASSILEGLDKVQREAVECSEGPVLIVAGAGSGKTRVLTSRIAYLLEKGVKPESVLALTFTKKAASEMKERIAAITGPQKARRLWMGTFHAIFVRFLRDYAESLGYPKTFTIYDTSESRTAVTRCIKELGLDEKTYKAKDVLSRISMAKNNLVTPDAYRANAQVVINDTKAHKPKIVDIYAAYQQTLRANGVMDFDDILLNMNILLRDNKEALENLSAVIDYILVDEYQDTNFSQYLILRKLSQKNSNICVVGDDSQSIYAFRGAKIENILRFQKDYPGCKVFRLERNYRSTQNIVNAANSLIANNANRIPKTCFSKGEEGDKIRLISTYSERDEAEMVASSLLGRIHDKHAAYQDFAVLYRTNNQSRTFEEIFRKRNIPYRIYSGHSFYDRAEVKTMMSYFKLAVNLSDDESFRRSVNEPARGIGKTTVDTLTEAAKSRGVPIMSLLEAGVIETLGLRTAAIRALLAFADTVRQMAAKAAVCDAWTAATNIVDLSGFYRALKSATDNESQTKAANVEELVNSVKEFVESRRHDYAEELMAEGQIEDESQLPDEGVPECGLQDFLDNAALLSAVDVEDEEDSDNKVAMMTVHSAKGLEFPYVYVVGMEENIFPGMGDADMPAELEEERRLFYVALTRAKSAVDLSFAMSRMRNGKQESNRPSRFISEIDSEYIANPYVIKRKAERQDDDDDLFGNDDAFGGSGYRSGFGGGPRYGGNGYGSGSRYSGGDGSSYGGGRSGWGNRGSYSSGKSSQNSGSSSVSGGYTAKSSGITTGSGTNIKPNLKSLSQMKRQGSPSSLPAGASRMTEDFVPASPLSLKVGMRVQHNRFGMGLIEDISGNPTELRARIRFDNNIGVKTLILNYAKLRIVE